MAITIKELDIMKLKLPLFTALFLIIGQGCASFNQSHIYSDLSLSTKSELNAEIAVNTNSKLQGSAIFNKDLLLQLYFSVY